MPSKHVPVLVLLLGGLGAFAAGVAGVSPLDVVTGTVRDGSGAPVFSAHVELRDGTRLLASAWTERNGDFRLSTPAAWGPGWTVRVDRLGFSTVERPVPASRVVEGLVLSPAPLPIAEIRAEADRDVCALREDPSARRLWQAAARRHAGGLDTLGIATYSQERVDTLRGDDPREVPEVGPTVAGQRTSASLLRASWTRRVEREGYAIPVRRSDAERSYDSWSYPPLEAHFAPHFVAETFGRLHEFHREGASGDVTLLTFCGTRTNRPYLEGTIEIGPDTLVRRVEWRVLTLDPDESAGGWARFEPASEGGPPPFLLPRESLTWRTLPGGEVLRRAEWYDGWITAPGDSVPFLPVASPATAAPPTPLRVP